MYLNSEAPWMQHSLKQVTVEGSMVGAAACTPLSRESEKKKKKRKSKDDSL
jgi:hypothetical protein